MNHIKYFTEYINEEFKDVTINLSRSGKTKSIERVYDDPSSSKSPSSRVLLGDELRNLEFQDIIKDLSPKIRKILMRSPGNPKMERLAVSLNNIDFLKDELKKKGELRCEYCDKGPLVIYDMQKGTAGKYISNERFKSRDGATVDHKDPQSKGGSKFDFNNLATCCYKCNQKKGSISYKEWMNRIGKPILESIEKEDVNNILMDLMDDFPVVRFYGYSKDLGANYGTIISNRHKEYRDNIEIERQEQSIPSLLECDKYQLLVSTGKSMTGTTDPVHWDKLRPCIEEFIERALDLGLNFDGCHILQEVVSQPIDISWRPIKYPYLPDILEGRVNQNISHATGLVGWITIDFKPKKSFFQKVKNKLKFL